MTQLLVILVCVAAVITEFFSILWGWIIFGFPAAFLFVTFIGVKQKKVAIYSRALRSGESNAAEVRTLLCYAVCWERF
jgi:hypothetical protein